MNTNLIGKDVRVIGSIAFEGRRGKVTSIGTGKIPIHVTLDGETWETDFARDELKVGF